MISGFAWIAYRNKARWHCFRGYRAARGSGEAKSPRVRLNKYTYPKLRFTASRGFASAPPYTRRRPRGSFGGPLGSNPGPRCSLEPRRRMGLISAQPTRLDQRTKTERRAIILLPNPVAAHATGRDAYGRAKIFKENNTAWNGTSPPGTAANALRMRRSNPCR